MSLKGWTTKTFYPVQILTSFTEDREFRNQKKEQKNTINKSEKKEPMLCFLILFFFD